MRRRPDLLGLPRKQRFSAHFTKEDTQASPGPRSRRRAPHRPGSKRPPPPGRPGAQEVRAPGGEAEARRSLGRWGPGE